MNGGGFSVTKIGSPRPYPVVLRSVVNFMADANIYSRNCWNINICVHLCVCVFNGLLADIQDFYETTLLDETKSTQQKTLETLQIVSKWEQQLTIVGTQLQPEVRYFFYRH